MLFSNFNAHLGNLFLKSTNYNCIDAAASACQSLSGISGGSVSVTGHSQGDVAVYKCLQGYEIEGTNVRKCQKNGQWSSTAPICTNNAGGKGRSVILLYFMQIKLFFNTTVTMTIWSTKYFKVYVILNKNRLTNNIIGQIP